MKTIHELHAICDSDNAYITAAEVHEIARECVWFCSDSMDHFYCVIATDYRTFGVCVFAQQTDKERFEVLIAQPKSSEVPSWCREESDRFYAYWSKARAEAMAHAVAQSMTDGYGLQDEAEVSQGFMKSYASWF